MHLVVIGKREDTVSLFGIKFDGLFRFEIAVGVVGVGVKVGLEGNSFFAVVVHKCFPLYIIDLYDKFS